MTLVLACARPKASPSNDGYSSLACDTCSIQLTAIATLGADSDSVGFDAFATLASGPEHELLVAPVGGGSSIGRYARDGRLLGTVGRAGHGPGEFEGVRRVVRGRSDSLLVLDDRLTVLTPTFAFVRSANLPAEIASADELVVLANGSVVLNGRGPKVPPLVLVTPALDHSRAIDLPMTDRAPPGADRSYALTRDGSGGFWAARAAYRYELLHVDSSGTLRDSLTPFSSWYESWTYDPASRRNSTQSPPHTRIGGIWRDAAGRLWVIGASADRNWKPVQRAGRVAEAAIPSLSTWSTLFDSHVDVIDPKDGSVVASRAYDGILQGFTSDGLIWEVREEPSGGVTLRVIRASLEHEAGATR
jgi:hypothetical protein